MIPLLLGPLADIIEGVVRRLWPDPAQQAVAQFRLAQMVQTVPALVYVVRIDRRMGQIDALSAVNKGRIDEIEAELIGTRERLFRIEYSSRHA